MNLKAKIRARFDEKYCSFELTDEVNIKDRELLMNFLDSVVDEVIDVAKNRVVQEDHPRLGSENQEIHVAYANGWNSSREETLANLDELKK